MKIRLVTNTEYELVHEADAPPFNSAPDVVVWGSRIFVFLSRGPASDGIDRATYREAFAYTLV